MPVVINEFELLPESSPVEPASKSTSDESVTKSNKIEPPQLVAAITWLSERSLRVWAH
jgi:hypothetical protein